MKNKISIWLDQDLALIFKKINHETGRPFFEHRLRSFFQENSFGYLDSSGLYKIIPESFRNVDDATQTVSRMILRIKFIHRQMKHLIETLDFLEPYLSANSNERDKVL